MSNIVKRRTLHLKIDVRGLLHRNNRDLKRQWGGAFSVDGRKLTDPVEIRDMLLDQLAQGREYLPVGKPCEGWDYRTGCPGHEEPEESETP